MIIGERGRLEGSLRTHVYAPPGQLVGMFVLEDAIRTIKKGKPKEISSQKYNDRRHLAEKKEVYQEAIEWFNVDDYENPFSFIRLCEVFNLEPSAVRKELSKYAPIGSPDQGR